MNYTQYEDFMRDVYLHGDKKEDRTGTGTRSTFGGQMKFNLQDGFPLVTTKKIFTKAVIAELLWFLVGSTDNKWLNDRGVTIWDEWADEHGQLGPIYGAQWRAWRTADGGEVDQISKVVSDIKRDPYSRRLIVNSWNVGELDKMALMPCHVMFQFYVSPPKAEGGKKILSCQLYQRSADIFLGVPFNIASYALLTHMVAQQCSMDVGTFIWAGGDCHIYDNHIEQVELQLSRTPMPYPKLNIKRKPKSIFGYELDDFEFVGYAPHPAIKAQVAV